MSEFTYAILVKNKDTKAITKFIKAEGLEGYFFDVNDSWSAITIEDQRIKGKDFAEKLSNKLSCFVFNFINAEDNAWAYRLYNSGESHAYLMINYEEEVPLTKEQVESANVQALSELGGNKEELDNLQQYLHSFPQHTEVIFDGVEYFKKAFGFEKISWFSYDYLSQVHDDSVIHIEKKNAKKSSFQKTLKKVMEKRLNEMGFHLVKGLPSTDYGFVRDKHGFHVGLKINHDSYSKLISARVKTIFTETDLTFLTEGKRRTLYYEYEEDLVGTLNELLITFIDKGIQLIRDEIFEMFELHDIYKNIVDNFFETQSFKKVHIDENLLVGGKVIYQKNSLEVSFNHGDWKLGVWCYVKVNGENKNILDFIPNNERFAYQFKNRDEYVTAIKEFMKYLQEYYLPTH